MNGNGQLIETLGRSELYRHFEHAYGEAIGLPLALRPVETWQLPLHGKRHENAFCALMAERSHTCASCLRAQERLAQSARDGAAAVTCTNGLSECAVPVRLGTQTIGFLQTGQVLAHPPTAASFERVLRHAHESGVSLDEEQARKAYFATPVVSTRKMNSMSELLAVFAEHLSLKCNQISMQAANAEPRAIVEARRYIVEHHKENISLAQVAKAVNISVFYFCKLFHKVTGMTFTEFVSRTRVEKARSLLLNRNLRIGEIAYEVGFQSLTHFNRVFRKIVGESPTRYRSHLPHPA